MNGDLNILKPNVDSLVCGAQVNEQDKSEKYRTEGIIGKLKRKQLNAQRELTCATTVLNHSQRELDCATAALNALEKNPEVASILELISKTGC